MTTQPVEEPEPGPIGPPHDATAFEDSVSTLTPAETKAVVDGEIAAARTAYAREAGKVRTQYVTLANRQPKAAEPEPEQADQPETAVEAEVKVAPKKPSSTKK
jgi:hypothetical protein